MNKMVLSEVLHILWQTLFNAMRKLIQAHYLYIQTTNEEEK